MEGVRIRGSFRVIAAAGLFTLGLWTERAWADDPPASTTPPDKTEQSAPPPAASETTPPPAELSDKPPPSVDQTPETSATPPPSVTDSPTPDSMQPVPPNLSTATSLSDLLGPTFQVNGFIQSQAGIFVSPEKESFADNGSMSNHGGKLGQLSMFRNTLQLEADWAPRPWISLHAIVRGAVSSEVPADKDAQPPEPKKSITRTDAMTGAQYEEWVPLDGAELRTWVRNKYYNELALRELYVDIDAASWLNFRVGRQQVSWGETGQFRLLDVVNPINSTWHFGSLESFEDQRIPLWMLNTTIEIPKLQGNLQAIWIPMLDNAEDLVNTPLTFVGAWGLPPPKEVLLAKYRRKVFLYPDNRVDNSRAGARWKGEIGALTYSLVYFYTHEISPPIPTFTRAPFGSGGDLEVYSEFPRQHIFGLALELPLPYPIALNMKFEAAFEPGRTYPVNSQKDMTSFIVTAPHQTFHGVLLNQNDSIAELANVKKNVLNYAFTFQRPTWIRWLNPDQMFMIVLQFMHQWISDYNPADQIVEIPGYDTTTAQEHTFRFIGAIFTNYLHGLITPKLVAVFMASKSPNRDMFYQGGFVSASLGFTLGNHWRANLAVNQFFGPDAYDGLGLFRDRDEVNLSVRYQF